MNRRPAPQSPSPPRRADRLMALAARRAGRVERDALVAVVCDGCSADLGTAHPVAEVFCSGCGIWAAVADGPMPGMDG